jgi:phosphate uptake regulator
MSSNVDSDIALKAGIAELAQRVMELSMLVIEAYQSACAGLVTHDRDVSTAALGAAHSCTRASHEVHRAAVRVLAAWTPKGPHLTQIVALQRIAAEFERMGTRVGRIAEASLRLPSNAERLLALVHRDAPDELLLLVRHTYVMLRASLLITARQDRAVATHVLSEYGEVIALHNQLRQLLATTHAGNPQVASAVLPLHGIVEELALLAESASAIARACLQLI